MTEQDWIDYRAREADVERNPVRGLLGTMLRDTPQWGPLHCPHCHGPCLKAITTSLYPCEACGWGWYPADLDFRDPRRAPVTS